MPESLKKKAVKGVFWSSIENLSLKGVQFLVMLIMARLLTPNDYGLIGMLTIFIAVSQSLVDSGFSQALIRKQNRTQVDNSTVFYFNIIVGLVLYLLCFLFAPLVAKFYNTPELCQVMRVFCLCIIINSFVVVQRAQLTIRIDFKTQAKASFTAAAISGAIGITLAYLGYGVWALVFQQISNVGINVFLLWIFSKWKPIWAYSWNSFKELFSFGSKLMASGLLDTLYKNIYLIVIGKFFSASSLGHYTRAHHFAEFPSSNATRIMQRVSYPILCKIQDDDEKLPTAYRRLLRLSAFVVFPLMMGMSGLAFPFVRITVGDKWTFCSELLQIICFSMMWYPIHAINLNLLQVKGRSDLFLKLEIIKKIVGICILFATVPIGLKAMCYGSIVSSMFSLVINTYYTGKLIHVGYLKQMRDLMPTFLLSVSMFVVLFFFCKLISNIYIQLFVGILIGATYYIILGRIFCPAEFAEVLSMIKRK